jgi:hypothetical protein
MRETSMAKYCLYCGLQFSDTTTFCPNCGRLLESNFSIRPLQESEVDCLRREIKGKEDLVRQLILARTRLMAENRELKTRLAQLSSRLEESDRGREPSFGRADLLCQNA